MKEFTVFHKGVVIYERDGYGNFFDGLPDGCFLFGCVVKPGNWFEKVAGKSFPRRPEDVPAEYRTLLLLIQ